jgi:SP family general alpha glucoside:H+ symporter-like MFS transporter
MVSNRELLIFDTTHNLTAIRFRNRFGTQLDTSTAAAIAAGDKVVSSQWQTSIQAAGQCGQILGLYLNGWISDKIGYKKTMFGSLFLMIAMIFIPFFAHKISDFAVGAVLQGIPMGKIFFRQFS